MSKRFMHSIRKNTRNTEEISSYGKLHSLSEITELKDVYKAFCSTFSLLVFLKSIKEKLHYFNGLMLFAVK